MVLEAVRQSSRIIVLQITSGNDNCFFITTFSCFSLSWLFNFSREAQPSIPYFAKENWAPTTFLTSKTASLFADTTLLLP